MKKINKYFKRIFAIMLALILLVGAIPAIGILGLRNTLGLAAERSSGEEEYAIDNGYIKVTVSSKNGGFGIRTVKGDKVNKDDDDMNLLFSYDEDNTSFTSFQVERNGEIKEYIFGGTYEGSSEVSVSKVNETLIAEWSVDGFTFTQMISLVNSGANEHGMAYISYSVQNAGEPANVKCRILMDTSFGSQDYAYYNTGSGSSTIIESETVLGADGYNKAFYAFNDIDTQEVMAYTVNASVDNVECKPYQTIFAHWNNLAGTVFDYEVDEDFTFTNRYNKKYLTADSAYALYFDMGSIAKDATSVVGTNYGIFSNESVAVNATVAVNIVAPDVLQLNEDKSAYVGNGIFTIKTEIDNVGEISYEKVRIVVYTTGGIDVMDQSGNPANSTYTDPYYIDMDGFNSEDKKLLEWDFVAQPKENAQYGKVHFKVYDVSDGATQGTGAILKENLIGEGSTYILCPGSVNSIPEIKFTGSSPEILYTEGVRNFYITGDNFSMLTDASKYKVLLSRVDGLKINGKDSVEIPSSAINVDDSNNTMTVMLTDDVPGKLAEGRYELTFDYTDETKEDLTAPALSFQVKNDIQYKNDAYGFIAVIKSENNQYSIKRYNTEEEYLTEINMYSGIDRRDVLLEFRGSFIKEDDDPDDGIVVYKAVSLSSSDNVVVLNDCLDINNGTVIVTENNGSVTVDFDADIYTTGAGTAVWSGVSALTELEAGEEYGLIPYDENGNREDFNANTITLLWPSVGQGFQNILGLLFELKYGELGVIEDEYNVEDDTRVVAFGAAVDLSFIIPDSVEYNGSSKDQLGDSWNAALHNAIEFSPEEIRALNKRCNYKTDTVDTDATSWKDSFTETGTAMGEDASGGDGDSKSASIQIDDVLYGGKYLGVNFAVALGIPGYIDGMPAMEAILSVNTVGNWAIGASGVCNFANFYLEGSIEILSKDGIPIPNTLTFFMGGVIPGINLDCFGILWLQGAGGGIENLYDTIFMEDTVPPLKLILEAEFSVMQVISARATLGLSLRGINVSLSNGKVAGAIPVLNYAGIQLDWYPEFYLMGNVRMSVFDAIVGSGYIVVEDDGFFEFFLRAALQIPGNIPIVGGICIADASLGANADKIWGQVSALGLPVGVSYYWGSDGVDWINGSAVTPTYPELAGMDGYSAYCVGYNEEAQEALYAVFGMNFLKTASNQLYGNSSVIPDEIYTDVSATTHTMTMYENGCGKLLVIEWETESATKANEEAHLIVIEDNNANSYEMKFFDSSKTAEELENQGANANLTFDDQTNKATLAISFTNGTVYDKTWTITTPKASALVLYDVASLPKLSDETTVSVSGSTVNVTLEGASLNKFSNISFIIEGGDLEEATMVYRVTETVVNGQHITFEIPEHLSSGDYELSIQAQDENALYYSEISKPITFVNDSQPDAPQIDAVAGAGDYKVAITLDSEADVDDFDGYMITAYDVSGNVVTGLSGLLYYKNGTGVEYDDDGRIASATDNELAESIIIGGHYEYPYTDSVTNEEKTGIAGFSEGEYTLEVRRFKRMNDGAQILYSEAVTHQITVTKPVETVINVTSVLPDGVISNVISVELGDGSTYRQVVFGSNVVALNLSCESGMVKGQWKLDGGTREHSSGIVEELTEEFILCFADLTEGTHTLEFTGKNENGDATSLTYVFQVDTKGPRLLLERPVTGSTFAYMDGKLVVSGITDEDALISIRDNSTGKMLLENLAVVNAGIEENGKFTTTIYMDSSLMTHQLTIIAKDAMGNVTEKDVTVVSDGLGSIEELYIFAGEENITNKKITAGTTYTLALFAKLKGQEALVEINDADLIDWHSVVVGGEASIVQMGSLAELTTSEDAEGMVEANFIISYAGAYSICASFGDTGEEIIELTEENTTVTLEDQFYTGSEIKPSITVMYEDELLVEGVDYQVTYSNNINVSTDSDQKPQVVILGINKYSGTIVKNFEISYLPMNPENPYYNISGVAGKNGFYISDVSIIPKAGYELVVVNQGLETAEITFAQDGTHKVEFMIRRISDQALTTTVTVEIRIDKTLPAGTISLQESGWTEFLKAITFGHYHLENYEVTITSQDGCSGIDEVQYVILEEAYESIEELENADLDWMKYRDSYKPVLAKNKNQIVYVKVIDKAGNTSYICSEGIFADTVAPIVSDILIKDDNSLTHASLEFTFNSNEMGTYYYAVVPAGNPAVTEEELLALDSEGIKMGTGNITSEMIDEQINIAVDGLEAKTLYVVYVMVADTTVHFDDKTPAPNMSEIVCSNPVSTKETAPSTQVGDWTEESSNFVGYLVGAVALTGIAVAFFVIKKKSNRRNG